MKKWNLLTYHHRNIVDMEDKENAKAEPIHRETGEVTAKQFYQWFNTNFKLGCVSVQISWVEEICAHPISS
jgi:hypothetical protein